jgi:hypothetical protein
MAELSSYLEEDFDQGTTLSTDYKYKGDVQGGICAALCITWIKLVIERGSGSIVDLLKEVDLSINMQRIIKDAYAKVNGARADVFNAISHVTRIKVTLDSSGQFVNPFAAKFGTLGDGPFLLSISFSSGGAHMIAILKAGNLAAVMDPNFGIFAMEGKPAFDDFPVQLFAKYASFGMTISEWRIFDVEEAKSAAERMKEALAKLT